MKNFRIYIHTLGRANVALPSLHVLPKALHRYSTLLVQPHEERAYALRLGADGLSSVPITVLPPKIKSLSPTRQWILEHCPARYVCLMDDDLRFNTRRADQPNLLVASTEAEVLAMFEDIYSRLAVHKYAHVGVSPKEGSHLRHERHLEIGRAMRILAYDRKIVAKVGARFDRVPCKQDFDMTLQLLRAGYKNCMINWIAQGQYGSGRVGGCSLYRDETMLKAAAEKLVKLHPGFVKIVQKTTKDAWGGGVRTDVTVQWKKAYESYESG